MWKSKSWLDRNYGSIMPPIDPALQHVHDEENLIPLTIFSGPGGSRRDEAETSFLVHRIYYLLHSHGDIRPGFEDSECLT